MTRIGRGILVAVVVVVVVVVGVVVVKVVVVVAKPRARPTLPHGIGIRIPALVRQRFVLDELFMGRVTSPAGRIGPG